MFIGFYLNNYINIISSNEIIKVSLDCEKSADFDKTNNEKQIKILKVLISITV